MPYPSKLPAGDVLRKLNRTMTRQQIADTFGVSKSAVTQAMQRAHIPPSDRPGGPVAFYDIPWEVQPEHQHAYAADMMRALLAIEQGMEISERRHKLAEGFRRNLERNRQMLAYNPDDGFFMVRRKPGEKGFMRKPGPDGYVRVAAKA